MTQSTWARTTVSKVYECKIQYIAWPRFPICILGFPGGTMVKNLPAGAGDTSSFTGLGRSPRRGNGNPLQYSCLENSMDRGAWRATVHGVAKI